MKSAMKKHLGSDNKGALILLMALICVLFTFGTQGLFLNTQNIRNILVSASLNGIIGIGMTFVLITGGIDLSVTGKHHYDIPVGFQNDDERCRTWADMLVGGSGYRSIW